MGSGSNYREPFLSCRHGLAGRGLVIIFDRLLRPPSELNFRQSVSAKFPECAIRCFVIFCILLGLWFYQMLLEDELMILCQISGDLAVQKESPGIGYGSGA